MAKNIVFLGTSHIAKQSLDEVKAYIEKEKPEIVALELDQKRLSALLSKSPRKPQLKSIMRIGIKGFVFSLFGAWAEKKLGKVVGVAPGSEMRLALKIAKKKGIKVALIDQDIAVTLSRVSKTLSWREKRNFLADILNALIFRKREIDFDLRTVPEKKIIKKMTEKLKARYPNLYKVLIEERNHVLAKNLKNLVHQNPDKKILAIIGAGHVDEVSSLIDEYNSNISYKFSVG